MKRNLLRVLITAAAMLWSGQAYAQRCAELYRAIKSEAIYCGFFCDQERAQPLQVAYEALCIPHLVPFSIADMEPTPYHALAFAVSEPASEPVEVPAMELPEATAPRLSGKQSMLLGDGFAADPE
jgi:hypothetical protein